jgi:tRNA threonylcarbamoyladenosine modification (KEOPS) complex Cgi121 subunit
MREATTGKRLKVLQGSSTLSPDALVNRIIDMNSDSAMIQVFNISNVINELHLQAAYANAIEAFSEGTNISKKLYIEFLLFAAMTRQIGTATRLFKVEDTRRFVIASDKLSALDAAKGFIELGEFKNSERREIQTAKTFGIDSDYARLNQRILQKMAVSRLLD